MAKLRRHPSLRNVVALMALATLGTAALWRGCIRDGQGLPLLAGPAPEANCSSSSSSSPAAAVQPAAALQQLPSPLLTQIEDDLEPFRQAGITPALLDAAQAKCVAVVGSERPQYQCYRYLIKSNRLYLRREGKAAPAQGERLTEDGVKGGLPFFMIHWMLLKLLCRQRVPDVEFVLSTEELPLLPKAANSTALPIFSWPKTSGHWDIQYPYHEGFGGMSPAATSPATSTFNASAWRARQPRAVWRGATTGAMNNLDTWNTTIRTRLVGVCRRRRDLCDAAFTDIVQADPITAQLLNATYGLRPRTSPAVLEQQYQYLIVVGGNGEYTASRSIPALASELTPLWAMTEHREFFAPLLQPWEHYIPVSKGWEDLFAKIEWARANPAAAERIARAGQALARRHFNTEGVNAYLLALLSEYARLQRFAPALTERHVEVAVAGAQTRAELGKQTGGCGLWGGWAASASNA